MQTLDSPGRRARARARVLRMQLTTRRRIVARVMGTGGLLLLTVGLTLLSAPTHNRRVREPPTLELPPRLRAAEDAASYAEHLRQLHADAPHHVCVTGSHALNTVREELLPAGVELQPFEMPAALAPDSACGAWQAAIGHTLLTVATGIPDRCAARWRVHASTCDALVHAEAGSDCVQLLKLHSVADQSSAQLLVLGTPDAGVEADKEQGGQADESKLAGPDLAPEARARLRMPLLRCYEAQALGSAADPEAGAALSDELRERWLEEWVRPRAVISLHADDTGRQLRHALVHAHAETAAQMHASHGHATEATPADSPLPLRGALLQAWPAAASAVDVPLELLKAAQGVGPLLHVPDWVEPSKGEALPVGANGTLRGGGGGGAHNVAVEAEAEAEEGEERARDASVLGADRHHAANDGDADDPNSASVDNGGTDGGDAARAASRSMSTSTNATEALVRAAEHPVASTGADVQPHDPLELQDVVPGPQQRRASTQSRARRLRALEHEQRSAAIEAPPLPPPVSAPARPPLDPAAAQTSAAPSPPAASFPLAPPAPPLRRPPPGSPPSPSPAPSPHTGGADLKRAAVVIDTQPGAVRAGIAGEDAPRAVLPTVVGRPRYAGASAGAGASPGVQESYVGDEALRRSGLLRLSYPMEYGLVTDWDAMGALWAHVYAHALQVPPSERPVLFSEPPLTPRPLRERMAQIAFEQLGVPAFYVACDAVLALYAAGRTTGLVLTSNEGATYAVPVHEGFPLTHAIVRTGLSGGAVTEYLARLLGEGGRQTFSTTAELETVRRVRDELAFVAADYARELARANASEASVARIFELPGGGTLMVGAERFRAPELLFDPSLIGSVQQGIHHIVHGAIARCDDDLHAQMFANVVLAGSNTMYDGLDVRLAKELRALAADDDVDIHIVAPPTRKYASWIGGSVIASLDAFSSLWISAQDYTQHGPSIVRSAFG